MSCACLPLPRTASSAEGESTPLERRLSAEWGILQRLAQTNPDRLADLSALDLTFRLTLRQTPGLSLPVAPDTPESVPGTDHRLRIQFSRFFPAAPMELYLDHPVEHPNVHPETGFVCLWDRHCVSNTVEQALSKAVAILGWRLHNDQPEHVMQPRALLRMRSSGEAIAASLASAPLAGSPPAQHFPVRSPEHRRRRLS